MIQYSLICENSHRFVAWFKSAMVFDEQVARDIVTCPVCATSKVNKALMAPAVSRGERQRREESARGHHGHGDQRHGDQRHEENDKASSFAAEPQDTGETGNHEPGGAKVSLSAGHPDQAKLARALRTLRDQITSKADYVGDKFALEARKIHDCEVEPHGIYGEATREEAASLLEDGIDFMPLPSLPEEQN